MNWVVLDETNGVATSSGEALTPANLAAIAEACTVQMNRDYATECGGTAVIVRAGAGKADVQPGERVFALLATLPDAPGDVAYHSVDGNGAAFALLAITTCENVLGAGASVSSAISHEILETEGDEGCNLWADDGKGAEHAHERCDACEVRSYVVTTQNGTEVNVSDFVLDAWFIPNAAGPYTYCAKALGASPDAPGPMQTVPAGGGNYQILRDTGAGEHQAFGRRMHGSPRNPSKVAHWSSRASRRAAVHGAR